jgi:lysophospholipid acyltransferase (LPLAT)-like uncharacterized protein
LVVEYATTTQKILGQANSLLLPMAMDYLLDYRIAYYDRSVDPARPEYNEHVVFAFWHEYIGVILPRWGNTPLSVLVSKHRDGEWVNQTAAALMMNIVRGSTTRGGSTAIRQLKKNSEFSSITFTPDGPKGPRREMALGAVYLASMLRMPIVPVGVGIKRPWRLNTWDRFAVPRPLSRVRVVFGPKIHLSTKPDRNLLETYRVKIQNLLNGLCGLAEAWAETGAVIGDEQPFTRARRTNRLFHHRQLGSTSQLAERATLPKAA